jgi:hypothetical protein
MTESSSIAPVEAECDPRSFPFQVVDKSHQHSSFRFRLFDAGPEFMGLSLPPINVLLFLLHPALLRPNVQADLAIAVTPTHTLIK